MKINDFYIGITDVKPLEEFNLLLTFENGKQGVFDVKPYLDKGVFKALKNVKMFNSVRVAFRSVAWGNNIDIAPESLYEKSKILN
jgi:hypothetical protein